MSLPVEKRRQWIKSRREQRKLTKYARLRRQLLRYGILCTLLTIGVVGFTRVCWQLSANKNAQSIEIAGNFVAEDRQIRQALKPEIVNTPLFNLNPTELENRIKTLSIVKHAFVRRYALPSPKLKVEVLEQFPWASLYCDASPENKDLIPQFVVAESGRLVSIAEFPHVYRPALRIYCNNSSQCNFNVTTVENWANWIHYISKETQSPVVAIDMRQPQDVKIETSKFKIALGMPDSGLTHRLYRLASVLGVLANQHKEPVYVNLGLNSNIPVKLAKKIDKPGMEEKTSRL